MTTPRPPQTYAIGEGVGHLPTNRYGLVLALLPETVEVIILTAAENGLLHPTQHRVIWKHQEIYRFFPNPNTLTAFALETAKRSHPHADH